MAGGLLISLKEAIATVALSHEEGHDCTICRANRGDKDALMDVFLQVWDDEGTMNQQLRPLKRVK